jgi:hypothetical protein
MMIVQLDLMVVAFEDWAHKGRIKGQLAKWLIS